MSTHDDDGHDGWLDAIPERLAVFEAEQSELQKRLAYIESQIIWLRSVPDPNKVSSNGHGPSRPSRGSGGPRKRITYEAVRQAIQSLSNDFKSPVVHSQHPGFVISSQIAEAVGVKHASPPLLDILREMVETREVEAIPFKRGNQYRWRLPDDPPSDSVIRDYRSTEGGG